MGTRFEKPCNTKTGAVQGDQGEAHGTHNEKKKRTRFEVVTKRARGVRSMEKKGRMVLGGNKQRGGRFGQVGKEPQNNTTPL